MKLRDVLAAVILVVPSLLLAPLLLTAGPAGAADHAVPDVSYLRRRWLPFDPDGIFLGGGQHVGRRRGRQ